MKTPFQLMGWFFIFHFVADWYQPVRGWMENTTKLNGNTTVRGWLIYSYGFVAEWIREWNWGISPLDRDILSRLSNPYPNGNLPFYNTRLFCTNRGWVLNITWLNFWSFGKFLETSNHLENFWKVLITWENSGNFSALGKFVEISNCSRTINWFVAVVLGIHTWTNPTQEIWVG